MASRPINWRLLRILDAVIGTLFLVLTAVVFLLAKVFIELLVSAHVERLWQTISSVWGASIAAVLFVLFAARPAQWLRGLLREPFIRRARAAAKDAAEALISGRISGRPIILFLHSFSAEASARAETSKARDLEVLLGLERYFAGRLALIWLWPVVRAARVVWGRLPVWRSTDEYVTEALWPEYLVVSVGGHEGPRGVFGAQVIATSDELWRERVERVAELASAVVVVPGATGGVGEEISLIASSATLRGKSVFVWPSMEDSRRSAYANASDTVFQSGVRVPHFDERGLIFDLRGNSEPLRDFMDSPKAVRRIVIDRRWRNEDLRRGGINISVAAMITGVIALIVILPWLGEMWANP